MPATITPVLVTSDGPINPVCWKAKLPDLQPSVPVITSWPTYPPPPSDFAISSSAVLLPSRSPLKVREIWTRLSSAPSASP